MRLATYNIENLFTRARVFGLETWNDGRRIVDAHAEFSRLAALREYPQPVKERMLGLLKILGLEANDESPFAILRQQSGELVSRSRLWATRITANGRGDWMGSVDLRMEAINPAAIRTSAQVVRDVDADVFALQEVESRLALLQFQEQALTVAGAPAYDTCSVLQGNDPRGLEIAVMAGRGHTISTVSSMADLRDGDGQRVFDRDCQDCSIITPSGSVVRLLVVHLKSKGNGMPDADRRRMRQAEAVRQSYERILREGARYVAVIGDLGDTPDSAALAPLLADGQLRDVSQHPAYQSDGHLGTHARGTSKDKLDYILLSPPLFVNLTAAGIWRRGVWGPAKLPAWDVYPEMRSSYDAASDHAALWCDLDV